MQRAGISNKKTSGLLHEAYALQTAGNNAEAVAIYRKALKLDASNPDTHYNFATALQAIGRFEEAFKSFQRAVQLRPNWPDAHWAYAQLLEAAGRNDEAIASLRKAIEVNPGHHQARQALAMTLNRVNRPGEAVRVLKEMPGYMAAPWATETVQSIYDQHVPSWHFSMMADHPRNQAYNEAIKRTVKPDSIVLEIGTGSGVLAVLAAKAGAKHVYTCETVELIALKAREVIAKNGVADRVTVIPKLSTDVVVGIDMPVRANLLVTETFSTGVTGEGVLTSVAHALQALLTPDAILVPESFVSYAMLVESQDARDSKGIGEICGVDVSPFGEFSDAQLASAHFPMAHFEYRPLSNVVEAGFTKLSSGITAIDDETAEFEILEDGTGHILVSWFSLNMVDDIVLDSAPKAKEGRLNSRHWGQRIQYLRKPIRTTKGQRIKVRMHQQGAFIAFSLI